VIIIDSNETPIHGFEILIKNNIMSAPVYDAIKKEYVGFLDIRDLISYTVFAFENRNTVAYTKSTGPFYTTILENVTITYLARRNAFHPVPLTASLYDVALQLAKGAHRVPVTNPQGKVVKIVSQSSLIQLFNKHLGGLLKEDANVKIGDAHIGTSPVISVRYDTPAITTFKLMDDTRHTSLAIIDAEGKLIGNISGRDLKLFIEADCSYELLTLPMVTFLTKLRNQEIDIRTPTMSVNISDSLGHLIGKLAATRVHRLYVVKDSIDYSPVRVISLTDTLKYILQKHKAEDHN
jgi:CBS domain-containing protein